jgi:chromate transporter
MMKISDAAPSPPLAPLGSFLLYFLKLGTIGFGGPIALAGHMQRDLVDERGWISKQEYLDGLALAQLAPGPLAAQLAMYLGYVRAGILGATLVGAVFILPSFLMVLALAAAYVRFGGLPWMQAVFYGIGAAVVAIIARSAAKLGKTVLGKDRLLWVIFAALAVSTAVTKREIAWLFVLGGVVSLAVKAWPQLRAARATLLLLFAPAIPAFAGGQTWQLLLFFGKAGLFVFGSGLAIVPFLHGGVVQQHAWLNEQQFLDAVAVAMITPGPVVITVAFIGYLVAGIPGAFAAGAGVFLPVYAVVLLLGPYYHKIAGNTLLRAFVQGVTAAAVGAIAGAVVVIARGAVRDLTTAIIAAVTLLLLLKWKLPEPAIIAAAAVVGLLLYPGAR